MADATTETIEREIKLEVSDDFTLPPVNQLVADGASVRELPDRQLRTEYFDTSDLRLTRWGCSLRLRADDGWTVKLPVGTESSARARDEVTVAGHHTTPPLEAVRLVAGFSRAEPLGPVVELNTTRRPIQVLDPAGVALAEVVDDVVVVDRPGQSPWQFRMLEIELAAEASPKTVARLLGELERLGARSTHASTVGRALGRSEVLRDELVVPEIGPMPTAREVVVSAVSRAVRQLILVLPHVRLGDSPEALHRARVAVRRLRSDLRTFGPLLEHGWANGLTYELRWFGAALGEVRDLDVLIETLTDVAKEHPVLEAGDERAIMAYFAGERAARRRGLIETLDSPRTSRLLDELVASSRNPRTAPQADDPSDEVLPRLARKPWRRLEQGVESLGDDPPNDELHRIRILAKRARYAADAVEPASGPQARKFSKAMGRIQDCLGDLNDTIIIGAHLRDVARDDPSVAFPAGQLSSMLALRAEHSRSTFEKVWRRSSDKRLRQWW